MKATRMLDRIESEVRGQGRKRSPLQAALRRLVRWAGMTGVAAGGFALGSTTTSPAASEVPRAEMQAVRGRFDLQTLELERLRRAHAASSKHRIGADLALAIEEIARAEQIDPELAFDLVRVESRFQPRAVSSAGALGYTQLMPGTARMLMPGITREQMFDRDINLRLGFRHLRWLITYYKGDINLALLAYNRGPGTVDSLLARGLNPNNGYVRKVLGE